MRLPRFTRLAFTPSAGTLAVSVLLSALVACGSSSGSPSLAMGADAGSPVVPANTPSTEPTGSGCTQVTETYAICENLSTCPGVIIDPNTFPDCGYSVHGNVIDPECLCFGGLCSMGAPETCAEMQTLLTSGITVTSVCAQAAAGHCQNLGSPGTVSTCAICRENCDGNLTCLQECGC